MPDVFVSYSTSDDSHLVNGLVKLLHLSGRKIFLDRNSIERGQIWQDVLKQAITESQQIVVLWCCHAHKSKWVTAEVELAIEQDKAVIPLLMCGQTVPPALARYQWIDLRDIIEHHCDHDSESTGTPEHAKQIQPMLSAAGSESPSQYLDREFSGNRDATSEIAGMSASARALCGAMLCAIDNHRDFNFRGDGTAMV